jgi:hypothetical protein
LGRVLTFRLVLKYMFSLRQLPDALYYSPLIRFGN